MSKDETLHQPTRRDFRPVVTFKKVHGPRKTLSHPCFYVVVDWRAPLKGEWFLDGVNLDRADRAEFDFNLNAEYWIVQPTHFAMRRMIKGEPVDVS